MSLLGKIAGGIVAIASSVGRAVAQFAGKFVPKKNGGSPLGEGPPVTIAPSQAVAPKKSSDASPIVKSNVAAACTDIKQAFPPTTSGAVAACPADSITLSDADRVLIRQSLTINEGANPYKLSHAGTDNSGYSIGAFQYDFGQHKDEIPKLTSLLSESPDPKFSDADIAKITGCLGTKGQPSCIDDATKKNIGLVLSQNKQYVDTLDDGQLSKTYASALSALKAAQSNPLYGADADFTNFVSSPTFVAMVADHTNQFGNSKSIETAASNGNFDFDSFVSIESETKYAKSNPNDLIRRRNNILSAAHTNGDIDDATYESYHETVSNTFGSDGD